MLFSKKIILVAVFAIFTLVATPALAQSNYVNSPERAALLEKIEALQIQLVAILSQLASMLTNNANSNATGNIVIMNAVINESTGKTGVYVSYDGGGYKTFTLDTIIEEEVAEQLATKIGLNKAAVVSKLTYKSISPTSSSSGSSSSGSSGQGLVLKNSIYEITEIIIEVSATDVVTFFITYSDGKKDVVTLVGQTEIDFVNQLYMGDWVAYYADFANWIAKMRAGEDIAPQLIALIARMLGRQYEEIAAVLKIKVIDKASANPGGPVINTGQGGE